MGTSLLHMLMTNTDTTKDISYNW